MPQASGLGTWICRKPYVQCFSLTREPPVAQMVANVNVPNLPNAPNVPTSMVPAWTWEPPTTPTLPSVNVPDGPMKRKQKGKCKGDRHRKRDISDRVVEEMWALIEWHNERDDEEDKKADEIDCELHNMDRDIRKEFANLFNEPVGLPPRPAGIEDF
jgi:hypothetical protein